ncbi:MAG TPA: efflux RND transporter permease subunit [Xanthobacteraceae bacterium]
MALNVSAWSIRQPLPAIVIMAILLGMGYISLKKMPITRMPNVDVPAVSVVVTQFGASPAELETQVSQKIEDAVAGVAGSHHIYSTISDGIANTTIQFQLGTNSDRALNDVKDAVTRIRADLPRSIDEPLVQRFDVVGLPILTYAAIAPSKTPEQISWFVENVVVRKLQGLRGVGSIDRIGSVEREVRVGVDPLRLQALGLTVLDISRQLRGSNVDVAGGRSEIGGRSQAIRTLAQAKTIPAIQATRIALPGGGDVRLDDIGLVTDTISEPTTFARFNGAPVVGFSILRAKGASDVEIAKLVDAQIEAIKKENPDFELKLIDSSVTVTLGNYDAAVETLIEGALLAIIIVFLFLRDWRATLIAAVTLPLSILPSFWVMHELGFSLNLLSLLAIVLSTGILVDDAIVEVENIVRHIRMGKSPYDAAMEAADEIGIAVIAISLTIVAVFLPAGFMTSVPGQFFKQFGLTVSIQVLFSLLCARLITPMMAAYFLAPHQHEEKADGPVMRRYTRLLTWSVRHRWVTIGTGLLIFLVSMAGAGLLPSGFLPPQDTGRSILAIELPPGSQLADTQTVTDRIANRLLSWAEVDSVFVNGGKIPPVTQEVRKATLTINYVAKSKRKMSQAQLEQAMTRDLSSIPDFRFWFPDENGDRGITYIIAGSDVDTVANFASDLAWQMQQVPQVANIIATAALNRPELQIFPRRDLAVRLGVSTESLSEVIRVATIGDVAPALARYDAGGRIVPIRVLLEERARADPQVLEQLRVPSPVGGSVPLASLADIRFGESPVSISRYDRERQSQVEADLIGGAALSEASERISKLPLMQHIPPGITVHQGGQAEYQTDLFDEFGDAMRTGLTMVYALLAVLFGSLLQPLTILLSLPLSVAGAIMALLATKLEITTPVLIGILMLMGIVSKNAIMLVDFGLEAVHRGAGRDAAIIDAGQKRARPIIMTTIAMIGGMAPSALGIGSGGEFRSPMAIAAIGGLLLATLLSLLFVPAVFTLMDDLGKLGQRVFGRFLTGARKASPHPQKAGPGLVDIGGPKDGPKDGAKDAGEQALPLHAKPAFAPKGGGPIGGSGDLRA